jgi:hypothetical protein
MIEEKGLGGKKVNRVGPSLSNHYDKNLRRLATACNMPHTKLAGEFLEYCLDNEDIFNCFQSKYCTQKAYKLRFVRNKGKVHYVLTGREDLD